MLSQAVGHGEATSAAADEGTKAHELGEMRASLVFGKITLSEYNTWYNDWKHRVAPEVIEEMHHHIDGYVELLVERMARHPHSRIQLEQSMPSGIDGCWGTSDAVIVSPVHIEVIDLKYGKGIAVSAVDNSQLRLYGLGALDTYGDVLGETNEVVLTIYQPRNGGTSSETITAQELRTWRERIRPIAAEALRPDASFGPSESACRFCPVSGECKVRLEYATQLDFGTHPKLLTPEELAEAKSQLSFIRGWCDAVEETALTKAYSQGVDIPGYKVVLSGGRRYVTDPAAAIQTFIDAGYNAEQVANLNIKGIGALEKLVGKKDDALKKILGGLLARSDGKPALVPEDDPRPEISPSGEAAKDFS
jgi:hypothetical protein